LDLFLTASLALAQVAQPVPPAPPAPAPRAMPAPPLPVSEPSMPQAPLEPMPPMPAPAPDVAAAMRMAEDAMSPRLRHLRRSRKKTNDRS